MKTKKTRMRSLYISLNLSLNFAIPVFALMSLHRLIRGTAQRAAKIMIAQWIESVPCQPRVARRGLPWEALTNDGPRRNACSAVSCAGLPGHKPPPAQAPPFSSPFPLISLLFSRWLAAHGSCSTDTLLTLIHTLGRLRFVSSSRTYNDDLTLSRIRNAAPPRARYVIIVRRSDALCSRWGHITLEGSQRAHVAKSQPSWPRRLDRPSRSTGNTVDRRKRYHIS